MIITRAPFRISFAGGGSDLPSYYRRHGGCVLSTTINRYVYIEIHPFFDEGRIQLKYSRTENVASVDEIRHPIFRESLRLFELNGVELTSTADIPSGTGMGSSSAFTVALLQALHAYRCRYRSKGDIAAEACDMEINRIKSPIGKQDQYASAFGGLNLFRFNPDETVTVEPVTIDSAMREQLSLRLHLYYTHEVRDANTILAVQQTEVASSEAKTRSMQRMAEIAEQMRIALVDSQLEYFGELLHEGWVLKRSLTASISSNDIDQLYAAGRAAGATGGKLLGAGGGGFLLFYVEEAKRDQFIKTMAAVPCLKRTNFELEQSGVQVIHYT